MAHIFEVMSSVCGQLNSLAKEYFGEGKARTMSRIMDSISISAGKAVSTIDDMIIDKNVPTTIDKGVFCNNGDKMSPVYLISIKNIKKPFVDKIITTAKTPENDLVTGLVIGVPQYIFDDTADFDEVCRIIKDMYFEILNTDQNMKYEANLAIIRLGNTKIADIGYYDLSMALSVMCMMYVNIKAWFKNYDQENNQVYPGDMIDALNYKFPDDVYKGLINTIYKHGNGTNDIRDSIIAGTIITDFLDNE